MSRFWYGGLSRRAGLREVDFSAVSGVCKIPVSHFGLVDNKILPVGQCHFVFHFMFLFMLWITPFFTGNNQWRTEGVVWGVQTPPEIPKISMEFVIALGRRAGVSISFCSSLCSHTVVIY